MLQTCEIGLKRVLMTSQPQIVWNYWIMMQFPKLLQRAQARGLASLDWTLIWRCLCSLILLFPKKIIFILVARSNLFKAQVMWKVIHSRERLCTRIVIKYYYRCSSTYWHFYYQRLESIFYVLKASPCSFLLVAICWRWILVSLIHLHSILSSKVSRWTSE